MATPGQDREDAGRKSVHGVRIVIARADVRGGFLLGGTKQHLYHAGNGDRMRGKVMPEGAKWQLTKFCCLGSEVDMVDMALWPPCRIGELREWGEDS